MANVFDSYDPGAPPAPEVLDAAVERAGERHGVDPDLIRSVMKQESGGRPDVVSPQGAGGLMQLTPETAASLGVTNLFDWQQSLDAGTRYLRQGLDRYGDRGDLALAYYHGGPNTDIWGPRTANYANKVWDAYQRHKEMREQQRPQANPFNQFDQPGANPFNQFDVRPEQDKYLTRSQAFKRAIELGATMAPAGPGEPSDPRLAGAIWNANAEHPTPQPPQAEEEAPWWAPWRGYEKELQQRHEALGRIGQAVVEGYRNAPPLINPDSSLGKSLIASGFEGLTQPFIPGGAANAAWQAIVQGGYEAARQLGMPDQLARDVAGYIESAGMTGAPHAQIMPSLRYAKTTEQLARGANNPAGWINPEAHQYAGGWEPWHDWQQPAPALEAPAGSPEAMAADINKAKQEAANIRNARRPITPEQAALDEAERGDQATAAGPAALPAPEPPRPPRQPTPRVSQVQTPPVIALPGEAVPRPAAEPAEGVVQPTPAPAESVAPIAVRPVPQEKAPHEAGQSLIGEETPQPGLANPVQITEPATVPQEQKPSEPYQPPGIEDPIAQVDRWVREQGPDAALANLVSQAIEDRVRGVRTDPISARDIQSFADRVYGGKLSEGAYSRDRLYDAMELGVNRFIANNPQRFDPTVNDRLAHAVVADLEEIKSRLPTQTVRAGEKDTHQQFSTPPDYAYAAAWAANLKPQDRVLEPSAGTGSLAVHAKNAGVSEVVGNEISDKRRGMLEALDLDRLTAEDATHLHNALPDEIKPTAVLMNPPFSAAPGRMGNRMVLMEGARHVEQALQRLEPGGRLVAIVGRGMTMDAPAFKDWWKKIANQYDVRANVGVGGKIYQKYGTNFGTRLLVIDKITPSRQPVVGGEVTSAADLIDKLQGVRDDRPAIGPREQVAGEPGGAALAPAGQGVPRPEPELPGPTGVLGGGAGVRGAEAAEPQPAGGARPGVGGEQPPGKRPRPSRTGNKVAPEQPEPVGSGATQQPDPTVAPSEGPLGGSGGGAGDGVRPDGSGERVEPGVTEAPETVVQTEAAVTDPKDQQLTEAVYEPYKPQRITISGARAHPGALVQSAAMASVLPPETAYKPRLPASLVKTGGLSDAQLEAVTYAGNAHSDVMPNGQRRGFFIGDGTGVGKGREISGIFLDNWLQGRTKGVWVSEKRALINDARRDWSGIGQSKDDILEHGKTKASEKIAAKKGILFTSYDTLRSAEQIKGEEPAEGGKAEKKRGQSRVDQIVEWLGKDFDGVIAFDEAHNMGNSIAMKGKRGTKEAAAKALAGVELQNKLPNARVVYVSATGATEVGNLAYADRLGLWGEGTAFANKQDFISKVASGGMAAMELVARDMKALGQYIARNLSYDGVEYQRVEHTLTPDQRGVYDKLAEGWQVVLQNFEKALEATGADKNSQRKSAVYSAFWGAHQRFFNQIITAMQMPTVLKSVERDLKEGRQAVLQLVNTMEAAMERGIEKAKREGEGELEDLDMTPRDQLMQMVDKAFPTQVFEEYVDDNGNIRTRPAVDANGNPIHDKEMVLQKERLLDQLGSLRVPDGPLEILLNHFGSDKVAEVTGRKQRIVRKEMDDGTTKTVIEKRGGASNVADASMFQDAKKPILVFSEAGGTGRSYHAENGTPSAKRRRSHYLVQPGWRADKAVQGFGRTHRTNQASAPIFNLVTTDLQGQKRFISSIARRLGQLGALTKGERRAADQGLFSMRDNLESGEAGEALKQFFRDVYQGQIEGVTLETLEKKMGLKIADEMGLRSELPPMSQFLNRVLSLQIDDQNRVFDAFSERLDSVIERAASAGTLDTGVETYKADKITKVGDQPVYTDPRTGAETRHVHLETHNRNHPVSFEDTAVGRNRTGGKKPIGWVQNKRSGRVFAVTPATAYTNKEGQIVDQYRLTTPVDYQFIDKAKMSAENWTKVEPEEAKNLWDQAVANTPEFRKSDLHLITGAVLPIWDRLRGNAKIFRLQTEQGERLLGRVVPNNHINQVLEALGAEGTKLNVPPAEIAQRILSGEEATLANGWRIKPSMVAGERRLELIGPDYRYDDELARHGVFKERITYTTRYFIPIGDRAQAAIEGITKSRPIIQLGNQGGEQLYSFPGMLFERETWRRMFGTPSAKPANEILADKRGIAKLSAELRSWFNPTSLRGAHQMEQMMRRHGAEQAQSYAQAVHKLEQVRDAVDRLPQKEQEEMTWRMETGEPQRDPALQAAADMLRGTLDDWTRRIQSLGRGYLENAIDDYMGHIWGNYREWSAGQPTERTQGEMQQSARAAGQSKRPLQGGKEFLKRRIFPTQREGIERGLIPVTWNPIDLQLLKLRSMQKFYHGTKLADKMKESGIAHFVRQGDRWEAERNGQVELDDRVFQPLLYGASPIGPITPGAWFAPEPAARIFNRYMSRGLHGQSVIYDLFRQAGNALNSMQLGLSGFHATFVTLDQDISRVALGLEQALRGQGKSAIKSLLNVPVASVVRAMRQGSKLRQAWLDPEHASPEWQTLAEDLNRAGGRINMDQFYRSSASGPFFRSMKDIKNPLNVFHQARQMVVDQPTVIRKILLTPLHIAARLNDTLQEPLMGQMVPRVKLSVFADMARSWNEAHPDATEAERSAAMIRFWDSVDNRMGEMVYDNLFWHKALKDMAFVTTRSVGWNLGTIRELAGGVADSGKFLSDLARMQTPQFTSRMAYTMMMPLRAMIYGAMLTYLFTGQSPQELMDYFFPPTGQEDENGQKRRVSIPGYMKDVIDWYEHPLTTAGNKLHPLLETLNELGKNADYYGGIIYDPVRDTRIPAYADYLINQMLPFSFRAYNRLHDQEAPMMDQALAFFGIQPAPKQIVEPERGEAFQRKADTRAYRKRMREPGRISIFSGAPAEP